MKRNVLSSSRNRGLTLVETAIGAALLGTLLTMVVVGYANLTRQSRAAQLRLEAVEVADGLIENWRKSGGVPAQGEGEVTGMQGWTWKTVTEPQDETGESPWDTLRLSVFAPNGAQPVTVEVHLLVPGKKP